MSALIRYTSDPTCVNWQQLKNALHEDYFDNGRTPEQLQESFQNSFAVCFAFDGERIVGTARVLSDGVCNAYVADVWTQLGYRRRGIATRMVQTLFSRLRGQHVALFTEEAVKFYESLGFDEEPVGMTKVVGRWLQPDDSDGDGEPATGQQF